MPWLLQINKVYHPNSTLVSNDDLRWPRRMTGCHHDLRYPSTTPGFKSHYCPRRAGYVRCSQAGIEELKLLFRQPSKPTKNRFLSPNSSYINREYNQEPFNLNVRSWCKCQTNGVPQTLHQLHRSISIEWYNYELSNRDKDRPPKCELVQADLAPSHGSKMGIKGAV